MFVNQNPILVSRPSNTSVRLFQKRLGQETEIVVSADSPTLARDMERYLRAAIANHELEILEGPTCQRILCNAQNTPTGRL